MRQSCFHAAQSGNGYARVGSPLSSTKSSQSYFDFRRWQAAPSPSHAILSPHFFIMTSSKETVQESRRNGLRLLPLSTPFNNEPSRQNHHAVPTDPFFSSKRSSQRNKHVSLVPDSVPPNLKRRHSRFGLSSLFSRSKPPVTEEVHEKLGVHLECDESIEAPIVADRAGLQRNDFRPPPPEFHALPGTDPSIATLRNRASKTTLPSRPSPKVELTGRSLTAWDPPPLFQAYPQAVKHATLRAPTLCAETILRLNAERSSSSNQRVESYNPDANAMKFAKEKKLKRPTTIDVLSKGEWTDKTFVLVTSGYLLQYAGQGLFDRLPEKIMPLSKDSAAFASDAIPGKPYVLQISQVSDEEGTLDREASRSMFRSLGLRSQIKRSTSSFLLVFENPEDLSAWMVVVRKEIQAMGGKDYRPDEFRRPVQVESLHQRPSQRYLVKRDPNRSPQISDPLQNLTFSANTLSPEPSLQIVDSVDPASIKRQSMATQQSVDSRTTSNTADSINQIHLDRLKESPRQSYASTAAKTTSTSRDSSPGLSPVNLHPEIPQWAPSLNERRQTTSMYHGLVRSSVQQLTLPNKVRRESTISPATPPLSQPVPTYTPQQQRTPSPAAPNFSVPTFSKRYSTSNNSPALTTTSKPQTPPIGLMQAPPSPLVINEEDEGTGRPSSTIGETQHLQEPSPKALNGLSPRTSTFPCSADSSGPLLSTGADRPFSRRFSSLEYSKGVSPFQLGSHSPSPYPPPTTALPAIPGTKFSSPTSTTKPSLSPLPPSPVAAESRASSSSATPLMTLRTCLSATPPPRGLIAPSPPPTALPEMEPLQGGFSYPPPTNTLPAVPDVSPSSHASGLPSPPRTPPNEPTAYEPPGDSVLPQAETSIPIAPSSEVPHPSSLIQSPVTQESTKPDTPRARGLRRPVSMQVRSQHASNQVTPPQTAFKTTFDLENTSPPPAGSLPSPPRPTRHPPPPPSEQAPQPIILKSSPQIGREPPPVSTLPSPRSTISVISSPTNYSVEAAPHPFIPPIKVSERKFRGSLDGPWNLYGAPQRNFLDLSAI